MRKIKLLLLLPLLLLLLASCTGKQGENGGELYPTNQFEKICTHYDLSFIRDRDTDIMYMFYNCSYHTGLSAYYNEDGKPMTYQEFKVVHDCNRY